MRPAFWSSIGIFAVLATINLVLVLVNFYVSQLQIIRWRRVAQPADGGRLADGAAYHRGRFVADPIDNPDQRIQEDITSYAGISQSLGARCGFVDGLAGLVHHHLVGTLRSADPGRHHDPPGDGVHRLHLRDHRHGHRVPDRSAADPAQLPAGAAGRLLPLRPGPGPGELGERGLLSRRAGGERRAAGPVRRGHRQHLGDRLPEPEVPGLQLRGQPDRGGVPDASSRPRATSAGRSPWAT